MKYSHLCAVALGTFLAAQSVASAAILYTSLGPNQSYSDVSQTLPYPFGMGISFVPTQSGQVGTITLPLESIGNGPPSATLKLTADSGSNTPGTVLETWTINNLINFNQNGGNGRLETVTSALNPSLTAGTQYWLVVLPPSGGDPAWFDNDQGLRGTPLFTQDGGSTWFAGNPSDRVLGAMEIATAVPEPASLGLFGVGLAVLLKRRR